MKSRRKTHPVVRVLSLLIPLSLTALFLVLRDIAGFRVGSDTDSGAVYRLDYHGETLYHWYIFNQDGSVRDEEITDAEPYIWQDGDRISLALQYHEKSDSLSDMFFQNAEFRNYYPDNDEITREAVEVPAVSGKLKLGFQKFQKLDSGSEYVKLYQLTVPEVQDILYFWSVDDAENENLWEDFSKTLPEVTVDSDKIMLRYTEEDENQESVRLFFPQESYYSYPYHTDKDGTVFLEQAFDGFYFYHILYEEESAKTENFVNQNPAGEITSIDEAYFRAKNEVTIPYSLVTFRSDFVITDSQNVEFRYWEVTFSQMDNPEGETQTVYLSADGVTVLILDGKPES